MKRTNNEMYIPTYLNEHFERVPMENIEDIKKWNEVSKRLQQLDGKTWLKYMDAIGNYAWNCNSKETKKLYNRVYRIGKKLGFTVAELEMYFVCD